MTGLEAGSAATTGTAAERSTAPVSGAPTSLSITGLSRDGAALLLVDGTGARFALDISPRLRAAVRGDASRIGKVDTTMDSTLRPRDIQARIRAGESAEAVAEAAQTSVEKIMAFAGPVLAEREHVAERAQRSNLRRPAGESSSTSRTLGEAVETHLRSCNVDPDLVTWDAWRREDGRWSLVADYDLSLRTGSAHFTFDAPGNYVVLDDEDARWLVGELVAGPAVPGDDHPRDDLQSARDRRLGSVADDEAPLGDDAIELVHEEPTLPLEAFFGGPVEGPVGTPEESVAEEPVAGDPPAEEPPVEEDPPPRRPVQKKKGRASVPSWDEIMFGGPNEQ